MSKEVFVYLQNEVLLFCWKSNVTFCSNVCGWMEGVMLWEINQKEKDSTRGYLTYVHKKRSKAKNK